MLRKKGHLSKNNEGSLVLINEDGQSFKINQSVATIWKKCDGKTQLDLSREIAEERRLDFNEVNNSMTTIVGQLITAGLVDDVEVQPEIKAMEFADQIEMGTPRPVTHYETDENQQYEEKLQNIIKALRDLQKKINRIEEKIDNLKRFEVKAGDKLVLKKEGGKLLIEKV